jgi:hypothetical protein
MRESGLPPHRADDESASRIDDWSSGGIVVLRQELRDVAPLAVPLRPDGPADTIFNSELRGGFPAILHEEIKRVGNVWRISFRAKLGVLIEVAKCGVGYGETGRVRIASVIEDEVAILVYGRAGTCCGSLNKIVLPRVLKVCAPSECVRIYHLGSGVRKSVNIACPGARIWAGIQRRQTLNPDTRHLLWCDLRTRKQIRITQPICTPKAGGAITAEVDCALTIGVS